MFRKTRRRSGQLAAAIAATALALPATSPAYQDFRNPDNRDYGIESQREKPGYQDFRNPDNRDNGIEAQRGAITETPPPPEIAKAPAFDWGDAAIGAGSVLGLVLIVVSGAFAVVHRRRRGTGRAGDRPVAP